MMDAWHLTDLMHQLFDSGSIWQFTRKDHRTIFHGYHNAGWYDAANIQTDFLVVIEVIVDNACHAWHMLYAVHDKRFRDGGFDIARDNYDAIVYRKMNPVPVSHKGWV
jgi:hypothetical protein